VKELSQITACFIDHQGLYLPLAIKLAESYSRIIYTDPCESAFPKVNQSVIGDGFDKIDRVESFWPHKEDIDIFIFPDSQGGPLQWELKSQGFPVWGSFSAETIEQSREKFHKLLEQVGLQVPKFEPVVGIANLRKFLRDKEDKYIKISKYRGTQETMHWRSYADDEVWLDCMANKLGGVKDLMRFLVFDSIDTDLEIGADTYRSGGKIPTSMLDGYEWKDKGYFASFKPINEMPEQTINVLESFEPILEEHGHNNFWSMEIRVKDDDFWFIDATPRGPLPGTGSQMEIYGNIAEIIAAGAHGEHVDPEPEGYFAAECILTMKSEKHSWSSIKVPKRLEQWMKLAGCCKIGDRIWFPPDGHEGDEIGWLVAIGDKPIDTIENMLKMAKELPDGVSANTNSLVDLLKEIRSAEEKGIEFTKEEVPEPEVVIKDE
jgi:hypothetical protein